MLLRQGVDRAAIGHFHDAAEYLAGAGQYKTGKTDFLRSAVFGPGKDAIDKKDVASLQWNFLLSFPRFQQDVFTGAIRLT